MKKELTNRKSNFELLRIIAMMLIVMGHLGGQGFESDILSKSKQIFVVLVGSGARIAVNLFLMIGIWFMIEASFSGARIMKLYGGGYGYTLFLLQ